MKVGIFDSGIGGLTVLEALVKKLPSYDYIYLGDNLRSPYGERSSEEIYEFTCQGVNWLFSRGARIVILACNSASSRALRRIQEEWLPRNFPERRVLGIIIPIAQEVAPKGGIIGVLATKTTVESGVYSKELRKINANLKIIQIAAPLLVPSIENDSPIENLRALLEIYLAPLKGLPLSALILGCTHYSVLESEIRKIMGGELCIPDTAGIVAEKFNVYLANHPEIEQDLDKAGIVSFFTTGDPSFFSALSKRFFGGKRSAKRVRLP